MPDSSSTFDPQANAIAKQAAQVAGSLTTKVESALSELRTIKDSIKDFPTLQRAILGDPVIAQEGLIEKVRANTEAIEKNAEAIEKVRDQWAKILWTAVGAGIGATLGARALLDALPKIFGS